MKALFYFSLFLLAYCTFKLIMLGDEMWMQGTVILLAVIVVLRYLVEKHEARS